MKKLKIFSDKELENRNKGLVEIKHILDQELIKFLLFDGALLGAVREGNFIKWDWDVELALYTEDVYPKINNILKKLDTSEFTFGTIDPSIKNLKINVYKYNSKYSLIGFYRKNKIRRRKQWKYPSEFFDNTEIIKFLGHRYNCPSPPEKYLKYQYGDWQTPKKEIDPKKYLDKRVLVRSSRAKRPIMNLFKGIKKIWVYFSVLVLKIKTIIFGYQAEPLFITMLDYSIKEDTTFLDIGSSDGVESLYLLRKYKHIKIFLLEPDINNLQRAQTAINKIFPCDERIRFENLGVSNKTQKATFYRCPTAPNQNSAVKTEKALEPIEIQYVDLLSYVKSKKITPPLLIKMDIEGHEVEVLQGFLVYLKEVNNITILMEIHPDTYNEKHSLKKILEKLFNYGFKVKFVESAGLRRPAKFVKNNLKPIKNSRNRALYKNPDNNFILENACEKQFNIINYPPFFTKKIIRSILLMKS